MDFEIRSWLLDAVVGVIDLDDLTEWLTSRTWDLIPGDRGHEVAAAAKLRLAEYTNGHLRESELLDDLRSIATRISQPRPLTTGTSEVTYHPSVAAVTTSWVRARTAHAGASV